MNAALHLPLFAFPEKRPGSAQHIMTTQQIAAPSAPEGLGDALLEKIRTGAIGRNGHVRVPLTQTKLQDMALHIVGESSVTDPVPYDAADLYDVEQWADSMFAAVPEGEEAVLLLPNEGAKS